jgi:glycerol uptake facilitator-like aquaporin
VQVVGAVAAGAVVKRALGAAGVEGNFPLPQGGFNVKQAFAAETLCTAMFVSTIMHLGSATGFQGSQLNGLVVGASLMGSLLVGGGISGGGLNPAVVSGLFLNNGASSKQIQQTLWVYLVAPLLGATLAHVGVSMTSPAELGGK